MAFKFLSTGASDLELTAQLESFWIYCDFAVAAANGKLEVRKGYFATFLAEQGPPAAAEPAWTATDFRLDGGSGVGNLTLASARLRHRLQIEAHTEFGRLYLFEFDDTNPLLRPGWLNPAGWHATFTPPPIAQENQRMFHQVSVAGVTDRWAHWVTALTTINGTESLTAVLPFISPSVLSEILAATTVNAAAPSHMPQLTVKTFHRQQTIPDRTWTHFHGDRTALQGDVTGYVMVAQGAFQGIRLGDLPTWYMSAPEWDTAMLGQRLTSLVADGVRLDNRPRDLASFDSLGRAATVPRPTGNRPVEVLHLRGLNNSEPVL